MSKPSSDSEKHMTEMIILNARNDRLVMKDVKKAVQKAYYEYRKNILSEMDGDYRAFEGYMIDEINARRSKYASEDGLKNKVIRLAHKNPELREHLLPLLKES